MRVAAALWLIIGLCGCRATDVDVQGATLLIETSLSAMPSNVGSYRLRLTQLSGNNACGAAITSVTSCQTSAATFSLSNLCSGVWQVDAVATAAFASSDCSGAPLNAVSSGNPSPIAINYAGVGTLSLHFQGTSTLTADASFTSGVLAPALARSVSFKAQRTFNPDVASCATALTSIPATCVAATPGLDLPPAVITNTACSGQWILCAQAFDAGGCAGSVIEQGVSAVQAVGFGTSATLSTSTTVLGPNCPF